MYKTNTNTLCLKLTIFEIKNVMSETKKTWVGKLLEAIVSLFHNSEPVIDNVVSWADKIVNYVKTFEASQAGQLLETGIESIWPASAPLINAFKLWLPKSGAIIANIESFEKLSDDEKLSAFLNYLAKLKVTDNVLYSGVLNSFNAAIQQFFIANMGIDFTVQQSLSIAQVAHDPELATTTV